MTNDAPKRIWAVEFSCGNKSWTDNPKIGKYRKEMEYIHEDRAQAGKEAAVAAEREANAMIADEWYSLMEKHGIKHHEDSENRSRCFAKARQAMYIAQDIRARGDTDALAERDARVKAEALLLMLLTQDSGLFPEVRATLVDLVENAIDDVHDMDVTFKDYAESVVDALLKNVVPMPEEDQS